MAHFQPINRMPNDHFEDIDYANLTEGAEEPFEALELDKISPTDYGAFVLDALPRMRTTKRAGTEEPASSTSTTPAPSSSINQDLLRECLRLACSFLLTDSAMNPEKGLKTWSTGISRLVDIVIALDKTGALEVATMSEAAKACNECWVIAGAFPGLGDSRIRIREDGIRLRKLLDPDQKSYKGTRLD